MQSEHFRPTQQPRPQFDNEFLHAFKDHEFDQMYPESIRNLSVCHWSPVNVCRLASKLLVTAPGTRVLDIGCGPGKFCAIGAATTKGHFTGVEQRQRLVRVGRELLRRHGVSRVDIVHGNITEVNFANFDAFYLFNPFEENIFPSLRIDFDVELDPRLYSTYLEYVQRELSQKPVGTRVVTYCGDSSEIPIGYSCERMAFDDKLKLWVKRLAPSVGRSAPGLALKDLKIIGRGSLGLEPV